MSTQRSSTLIAVVLLLCTGPLPGCETESCSAGPNGLSPGVLQPLKVGRPGWPGRVFVAIAHREKAGSTPIDGVAIRRQLYVGKEPGDQEVIVRLVKEQEQVIVQGLF